jgi:hypothetical protein
MIFLIRVDVDKKNPIKIWKIKFTKKKKLSDQVWGPYNIFAYK